MKWLAIGSAFLFSSGCAQLQTLQSKGSEVADTVLESGTYQVCTAATIGAIRRRYGKDPEGMAAWNLFCEAELNQPEPVAVPATR